MTTTNLIERLEEAAYEWADYVVEDTAPRTLTRHLAPHIEAVAAALEAQAKQIEALNVTVNRWRDEYKELAERTQQDKVCAKDWRNLVQRSQLSGNDLNVQHLKDKCRDLEASKDCHDKVRLTLLKQIKALKQDYLDRCNELNVARMCFEEKIEALQPDAERWRSFRSFFVEEPPNAIAGQIERANTPEELDDAIDAARKGNV